MEKKLKQYGPRHELNLHTVIGLYRSYSRINRSTQRLLAEYKLTISQFGVLEALYHLGEMKIGDLIDKTLSSSGNMTVVVKNLEQEGLIQRVSDPADGRAYLVTITDAGRQLIDTVFPKHLKDLDGVLENLTEIEKEELIRLMKKLNGV